MTRAELVACIVCILVMGITIGNLLYFQLISVSESIQIILTFALVLVTLAYVKRTADIAKATKDQAKASLKTLHEMEFQRIGSVRPVLDIEIIPLPPIELAKRAYSHPLKIPANILCRIENIGVGPALDTYFETTNEVGNNTRQKIGVVKVNEVIQKVELTPEYREEDSFLVVNYRDIFDNLYQSSREIFLSIKDNNLSFGRTITTRIRESESE